MCAEANDEEKFVVYGLSFSCSGCGYTESGDCRIKPGGELLLVDCATAVGYLLAAALKAPKDILLPQNQELLRFLLNPREKTPGSAVSALRLLLRRADGDKLILSELDRLHTFYPELFENLVEENELSELLLVRLWDLVEQSEVAVRARVRAKIAFYQEKMGIEELIAELTVEDAARDIQAVKVYESTLRDLGSKDADFLRSFGRALMNCLREDNRELCAAQTQEFSGAAEAYLSRLRVKHEVGKLVQSKLPSKAKLTRIAELPYQKYRTPSLHEEVRNALAAASAGDLSWMTESPYLELLADFSRSDTGIKYELQRIVQSAGPELSKEKQLVIGRYFDLDYRTLQVKILHPQSILVCFLCTAVVLLLVGIARYGRARPLCTRADELGFEERAELRELRRYFSLSPRASVSELKKRYHAKARSSHPDSGAGSCADFAELQAKYERARELLVRQQNAVIAGT
jgi:hypothetical protein